MTHQHLVHPKHRLAFATNGYNRKMVKQQPKLVLSANGSVVRWRLMLDEQQLETGTARNKALARVEAQAAKRRVLSGRNWR